MWFRSCFPSSSAGGDAKPLSVQVGDGTTSVTLLAAEFLKQVKPYVEEGLHPQIIIRAFRTATQLVRQHCMLCQRLWGEQPVLGRRGMK